MKHDELIKALRRLKVETGSLACLGCGHEHNCGAHGCAILREAVKELATPRRPKPGKIFSAHIKTVSNLRRTAHEMARNDPEEPAWQQDEDALTAALVAMECFYGAPREEAGDGNTDPM